MGSLIEEYRWLIGRTGEENSLVCLTEQVPGNVLEREDGWRGFYLSFYNV
ncbi:hypothetical protein [Anaerovibrio slackiae]|nr:hypothetical protein [Anaerovibrio slackiae]